MNHDDIHDELPEPKEFNPEEHELLFSVQVEDLVLEVYDLEEDEDYRWELVDQFGRTHKGQSGYPSAAHALQAGLNVGLAKA